MRPNIWTEDSPTAGDSVPPAVGVARDRDVTAKFHLVNSPAVHQKPLLGTPHAAADLDRDVRLRAGGPSVSWGQAEPSSAQELR